MKLNPFGKVKAPDKLKDDPDAKRMEATLDLATSIINPYMEQAQDMPYDEAKDLVTKLIMALTMSLALLADRFMKTEPKVFAAHIAQYVESTMITLRKAKNHEPDAAQQGNDGPVH